MLPLPAEHTEMQCMLYKFQCNTETHKKCIKSPSVLLFKRFCLGSYLQTQLRDGLKKNVLCESVDLVWGASVGVNTFSKVTENTKPRQTAYIS